MIKELFEYLITPVPKYVRKIGFLTEGIGIKARWKRHQKKWEPHILHSNEVIKRAISLTEKKDTALVIGSGSLIDVPIAELSEQFRKVILIDLFHFYNVRRVCKKYGNIELINADITGVLEQLTTKGALPLPTIPKNLTSMKADLIISSNIASQLPLLPMDFIEEELGLSENESQKFGSELIRQHLEYLRNISSNVCLISDVRRFYVDTDGAIISMEDALLGNDLPEPDKKWMWEVAPLGELNNHYSMKNEVYGYYLFK